MPDQVIPRRMRSVVQDSPVVQQSERSDLNEKKLALKAQLSKEVLKHSPYLLGKHILNFDRFCEPHKEWDKFCRKSIDFTCQRTSKTLVLQPRECFKSTFWTVTICIEILINNPNASIFLISATNATSCQLLTQIKNHLAGNQKLIDTFGKFYNPDHWNSNSITIAQKSDLNVKEPSISALSKGSFITGQHPHFVIFDDTAGPADRTSSTERAATLRYFQDIWDILRKDCGQLLVIGTRWHREDIYGHVLKINDKLEQKFNCLITPAMEKDGTLNFPTILSKEKLDELRTIKAGKDALDFSSFSCQYLLDPIDPTENVFKQFHFAPVKQEYEVSILFCDPAISVTGCYSAICVLSKIKSGEYKNRWMLTEVSLEKRNSTKLINDLVTLHQFVAITYTQDIAGFMENNGFQALLKDNVMRQALENGYHLPLTGRSTTINKIAKITAIEPYITQGFVLFREDWETAPHNYRMILEQLRSFPNCDYFDGPDCLAMAINETKSRYFNMDLNQESTT